MDHLEQLENKSIYILREAYRSFPRLAMLWSIGKDSTTLVHLAMKAFFGHIPFPLIHVDTGFKIPEMIAYRDQLAREWGLPIMYGKNEAALNKKQTFPDGNLTKLQCCKSLKSNTLENVVAGKTDRFRFNLERNRYEIDPDQTPFQAIILGIRADEEASRSKERYFSPRFSGNVWNVENQPTELWGYYQTEFPSDVHVRVHPLLDWTELDIWLYIQRENIPVIPLYFNQGNNTRYRSLGCAPCTKPIASSAKNVEEVIEELSQGKLAKIAERAGRAQDQEDRGTLEKLRREGYM
jgi:sulfate adenylyltransferase subunit 2